MENNIEKEEKLIAEIKNTSNKNIDQIATENNVSSDYITDLEMLEGVLRLNKWQKETETILNSKQSMFSINWPKIALAASIVILISFSYVAFNKNYISDIVIENETLRGTNNGLENEKLKPQEKAYQDFINGKASYHIKEFENAILSFKKVLNTPNLRTQFREAVMWHLCVAYLQNNDTENCALILGQIEKIPEPKYQINTLDLIKVKTQLWLKKTF